MEITDVRIRKIDSEGKMKAVVSVTFDNEFVVHDIKVIESQNGLYAMPSRKAPDGEFRILHILLMQRQEERYKLLYWTSMSIFQQLQMWKKAKVKQQKAQKKNKHILCKSKIIREYAFIKRKKCLVRCRFFRIISYREKHYVNVLRIILGMKVWGVCGYTTNLFLKTLANVF